MYCRISTLSHFHLFSLSHFSFLHALIHLLLMTFALRRIELKIFQSLFRLRLWLLGYLFLQLPYCRCYAPGEVFTGSIAVIHHLMDGSLGSHKAHQIICKYQIDIIVLFSLNHFLIHSFSNCRIILQFSLPLPQKLRQDFLRSADQSPLL